jgi:hypothetical protein
MQPFEPAENSVGTWWIDANAVVTDGECPQAALVSSGHMDSRRLGAPAFQSIADQVLE